MPEEQAVADLNAKIAKLLKEAKEEDLVKIMQSQDSLVRAMHNQNNNNRPEA